MLIKKEVLRFLTIASILAFRGITAEAKELKIELPEETIALKQSNLSGYQLVQQNCLTCHSTQYIQYQPPSSRTYWEATVKKMKQPFGATFDDKDIPAMVEYLAKTYGVEAN